MLKNRMDMLIRCLRWQVLVHSQIRRIILAQLMRGTLMVVLLNRCSLILLYLSLYSTDLLFNEIDLFAYDSASSAVAALLFSRIIIALALVNRMIILVLNLR